MSESDIINVIKLGGKIPKKRSKFHKKQAERGRPERRRKKRKKKSWKKIRET